MDNEMPEEWPRKITAMRTVSYDTEIIFENLQQDYKEMDKKEEITFDEIINRIETYIKEDLSCGWGHSINLSEVIVVDENGEEY